MAPPFGVPEAVGSRRNGGELVAQALVRHGVKQVFALGGGHINPTWYALEPLGVKRLDVRHEAAAAHAAEGWAIATGEPGVCLVTAGPGATNAVTGVATAQLDGTPLLCIAGASSVGGAQTGEVQEMSQLELFRPITKWAERAIEVDRLPEYVALALRAATSGRPGVAYLEIPIDVIHSTADVERVRFPEPLERDALRVAPNPDQITRAARLVAQAERPVIVAGSGVRWSGAEGELLRLVERSGIPVVTRQAGRGAVSDEHPLSLGVHWERVVPRADLLLVVGSRFNYFFGYGRFPAVKNIIQIDVEPGELGRPAVPLSLGIVADAKLALAALAAEVAPGRHDAWVASLREELASIEAELRQTARSDARPIHPLRVAHEVAEVAGPDAILVPDGSNNMIWTSAAFRARRTGQVFSMGPLGTLGVGSGWAIGAACARPGTPVAWVVGDGSFGFNCMELDTAARFHIPLVAVVMNNLGWSTPWIPLGMRHYERLAPGFDAGGELVEEPGALRPALERAFAAGKPYIVNVVVEAAAEYFAGRR